jgi:hypothetical protein
MRRRPESNQLLAAKAQHGSVLVVCLLLAVLGTTLTVLAVQSTTYEQQMAAAARYRLLAFAAAEYCATSLANALIAATPPALPADIADVPAPGMPGARMRCRVQAIGTDAGIAARSGGALTGTHYTVLANGSSARNASAALEQGVLIVRNAAGVVQSASRAYWLRLD